MLHGPDPEQFRTKVYNARWYCDPLPACDIAPATEDRWPAVTTIKKAWSKPFRKKLPTGEVVPLDAFRAAEFAVDRIDAVNALTGDRDAAVTLIATSADRFLNNAGNRGTGVHSVLEDLGAGKPIEEAWLDAAVLPFVGACRSFIADWAPLWIAAEVIALNRTLGYGGTADAVITIQRDGKPWTALVDWKSRGGNHGAYEEEIAQIGGYSLAEYIVARSPTDGRPVRMEPPALDGGLVVSLTKDSYQLYPVNLDEAQAAFKAMHVSWHQHREGQAAARRGRLNPIVAAGTPGLVSGTPTLSGKTDTIPTSGGEGLAAASGAGRTGSESEPAAPSTPATPDRVAWLRGRIEAIRDAGHAGELALTWPAGTPTLPQGGLTDDHVDAIAKACDQVETAHRIPFGDNDPLFAAFAQDSDVALTQAVTAARIPEPTAQEWAQRARDLLAPLGDEAVQHAVAECAGAVGQKMTRRLHDHIAAIVAQVVDPEGVVALEIGDDGVHSIVSAPSALDRLQSIDGALTVAKSHAKALGLPAPRSLKASAGQPLLAALVAAGQ